MPPYKLESTLRRGSACLSCRKKKLKCDGIRPTCRQCSRLNRAHECEYDENLQKSRTQKLREQLAALEKRLHELESPSPGHESSLEDMALFMFDGSGDTPPSYSPPSTGTSFTGILSAPPSRPQTSSVPNEPVKEEGQGGFDNDIPFASHHVFGAESNATHWDPMNSLPDGAKIYLLEVFTAHRHQCWFYGSMDRFINPQNLHQQPHPALWNAIYLLACHYAQTPYYTAVEPTLLTQALDEINAALEISDRLVDIVQASSLLAIYLYINNRAVEGYRQAFSAVRLAVGLGLHQIHPSSIDNHSSSTNNQPNAFIPVSSPTDDMELSDRIFTFWQAFVMDRCWSVFHGLPLALPGKDDPQFRITTPWPTSSGNCLWENDWHSAPLETLMEGKSGVGMNLPCTAALKAKAAALYDMTARLRLGKNTWSDYQYAEVAVQSFSSTMPSLSHAPGVSCWSQSPVFDLDYLIVQTMIYTCFIQLQRDDLFDARAFKAGAQVVRLSSQLRDADYQYLDPIIGACWFGASRMFMRILENGTSIGNTSPELPNIINISSQGISVLVTAMKKFGNFSPLSTALATKVELHSSIHF